MSFDCLECRQEFSSQKSLHLHLKKHGGMAPYYQKHYPKRDLLDGELIDFENPEQYLSALFNSVENRDEFLDNSDKNKGREIIEHQFKENLSAKELKHFPCSNYIKLSELPSIIQIRKFYDTCKELSDKLGVNQIYNKRLPKAFKDDLPDDFQILIDTREQLPFDFKNSLSSKLDFGDYTVGGNYYSNTFVDRKSIGDFKGTFGVGFERFKKEVERCKSFGGFLFVVVEGSIYQIKEKNERDKFKTNLSYAFHNVRNLLREYPENLQFVFCKNKSQAKSVTERILFCGKDVWNCDLQFYIK